jgi:hypothetical protein
MQRSEAHVGDILIPLLVLLEGRVFLKFVEVVASKEGMSKVIHCPPKREKHFSEAIYIELNKKIVRQELEAGFGLYVPPLSHLPFGARRSKTLAVAARRPNEEFEEPSCTPIWGVSLRG